MKNSNSKGIPEVLIFKKRNRYILKEKIKINLIYLKNNYCYFCIAFTIK